MASVDLTRIASNIGALNSLNSLENINKQLSTHQTRLSTGKRINSAADDPAGLTIATKMLARSEGMKVALDNIGDAKNMLSVAEAGMSKINDILVQMRSKAEQAASDTLGTSERSAIQTQLSAYAQQIQDLVDQTKWNGVKLLDSTTGTKQFQTGVDEGEHTDWTMNAKLDPNSLNLSSQVSAPVADTTAQSNLNTPVNTGVDMTTSGAFSTLQGITTGQYKIHVMDVAASATKGSATAISTTLPSPFSAVGNLAADPTGTELDSGVYTFRVIDGSNNAAVQWELLDSTGAQAATGTNNFSGTSVNLDDGSGTIGVKLDLTAAASSFANDTTFKLEYIASGHGKYELLDGSGAAVTIDQDGASGTSETGQFGYFDAATATDTGVGVQFTSSAWGTFKKDGYQNFKFSEAGNYVVDVSTADLGAKYMTTVNTAMSKVNSEMSNLGSLMARLTFKEDQVSTAQINVEASYSRIMNANMAEEQVNASKFQILQQTATAMLAQANQAPQNLLSLFR